MEAIKTRKTKFRRIRIKGSEIFKNIPRRYGENAKLEVVIHDSVPPERQKHMTKGGFVGGAFSIDLLESYVTILIPVSDDYDGDDLVKE